MHTRRRVFVTPLSAERLASAKRSFSVRRLPMDAGSTLLSGSLRPQPGDAVLARVERVGNHRHIEQPHGRRAALRVGDEILVAYANRYATDQYESEVPTTLGPCQLVASGGIASHVITRSRDVRTATDITPIGLLGDERGRPINVRDFALPSIDEPASRPKTFAVLGTSMNSGKTTTIKQLVQGFAQAGYKVGATKVTGTGSGGDYWCMLDAGAHRMLDFTDGGMASTYLADIQDIEVMMRQLVAHLTTSGTDINLVEIADGVFQLETAQIIASAVFSELVDGVIFAAGDAMGAAMGVETLRARGHEVLAVSGRLTRAPLAAREAELATGLPVLTLADLVDAPAMASLLGLPEPAQPAEAVQGEPVRWGVSLPGLMAIDPGVAHHRDGSVNEDLAEAEVAPVSVDW